MILLVFVFTFCYLNLLYALCFHKIKIYIFVRKILYGEFTIKELIVMVNLYTLSLILARKRRMNYVSFGMQAVQLNILRFTIGRLPVIKLLVVSQVVEIN